MGQYFGLSNQTKNVSVCSYWKGKPPTKNEVEFLIKIFNWDPTDEIISGSHCEIYAWNPTNSSWIDIMHTILSEDIKDTEVTEDIKDIEASENNKDKIIYNFPHSEYKVFRETGIYENLSAERMEELSKDVDTTFYFN